MRALIGRQSVLSFSRACGVTESVLRSYLHDGRMPSLDRALAIAGAAGVSLDWLASERGPRAMAEVRAAYPIGGAIPVRPTKRPDRRSTRPSSKAY